MDYETVSKNHYFFKYPDSLQVQPDRNDTIAREAWLDERRKVDFENQEQFYSDLSSAIVGDIGCNEAQAQIIARNVRELDYYGEYDDAFLAQTVANIIRLFLEAGKV